MDIFVFLHYFISFGSFALLCYLPYTDRLIRHKRRIIVESTLVCIFLAALPVVLDNTDYSQADQVVSIVFYFAFFFYYKKTVQEGLQKLLFMTFIAVHMLCMGTELEFAITTLAGVFPVDLSSAAAWYALYLPLRIALYLVVGFIVRRAFSPRLRQIKAKDMKGLAVLPIVFASISIYRGADYYYKGTLDPIYPYIFLLLAIAAFFVYWQMLRMLDNITKNARLETETQRLTMEMEIKEQALTAENAALDRLNRMKNELIATVSHETMTPLAVLSGYAELVARELRKKGIDEQTTKDLDNIAEETQRISWLMDELRNQTREDCERLSKIKLNLSNLTYGVARLYTPIMARKNNTLTLNFPDELPDVYACPSEVTQVMFNVLQNSRNHTENGTVTITAELENDYAAVIVTDTGSGIPAELLPRAFERGVSGSEAGSGLGLHICREIIKNHDGEIEITSEYGNGTTLRFTLPLWKEGMGNDV